ncbi:MAG: HEAT repeat domain-containing protein [Chloroflexi bacterium]|nr:HEAT repeat domain-containing protein [Chloroflexota bacterium]
MSLEEFVRDLADPSQQMAASKLTKLSGLDTGQAKVVEAAWPEIGLRQRQQLVEELTSLAEDNVELNFDAAFQIALADRDPDVRKLAIRGLWENERREMFDGLLKLLTDDPAAAVRAEAALALGRFVLQAEMGTLKAVDAERVENALHVVIEDDAEEVEVRGRALESIGGRSERWVTDIIRQAFDGADRRLRISAAHAMGRSCDPAWLPRLFDELESDDTEMRFEAVGAIGLIADESAVSHLLPLLHDEDGEVQAVAVGALGEIGGHTAKGALEELLAAGDPVLSELALDALSELEFGEDPLSFSVRGDDTDAKNGAS